MTTARFSLIESGSGSKIASSVAWGMLIDSSIVEVTSMEGAIRLNLKQLLFKI
jgi:hypothetical protein